MQRPPSRTIYLVTGGFDPLHRGHIRLLTKSSGMVVGLNSDEWLMRKKGTYFMPFEDRKAVLEALGTVSRVEAFDDSEGHAANFLEWARDVYGPDQHLVFLNGGDRIKPLDLPEEERLALESLDIDFWAYGAKENSSSDILKDYQRRLKCQSS